MSKNTITNQHGTDTGISVPKMTVSAMSFEAMQARLKKIDAMAFDDAVSVSSVYWEAEAQGEFIRGVYLGTKEVPKTFDDGSEGVLKLAQVYSSSGVRVMAGVTAVDALCILPEGTAVQVTYLGKSGRTKKFDVSMFTEDNAGTDAQ